MKTLNCYSLVLLALMSFHPMTNASSSTSTANSSASSQLTGTIYMATIHTDNFAAMKTFYEKTLQLKVINESGEFVEFASQGLRLSLASYKALSFLPSDSLKQPRQGSGVGIGFKYATAQEVDSAYQNLISNGAVAVSQPTAQAWGEYTAFFADPDGNVHELVSDIK